MGKILFRKQLLKTSGISTWKLMNFDICVVYDDVQIDRNNKKKNRNTTSFVIYSVTIKISMTEYHHWINGQAYHLF